MKKMKTKNKCLVTSLAIVAMLMMSLGVKAQNVSIDLVHGSMLNAVTPGDDTGWANGFSTMWRHEQLSLSMMGADRDELTDAGEIGYPSAVFGNRNGNITIVGGRRPSYIVVSLPKGYRITGYELVLANDMIGANLGGNFSSLNTNQEAGSSNGYGTMRFYEVKPWETDKTNSGTHNRLSDEDRDGYNSTRVKFINPGTNWQATNVQEGQIGTAATDILATAEDANHNINIKTNDTNGTEYTISRTARNLGTEENPVYDMDNHLYFRLVKDYCFYGLTIKSFMIYFSAEGTFKADVVPDAVGQATSVVRSPFLTSKIDIGEMGYHDKDGVEYYSFDYDNVKDLVAYNYLYQEDAVENGKPADVATDKHIYPVKVDNKLLYALGNGTYYIEPPVDILNSKGNTSPIGYRIVGALFNYLWGTATPGQTIPTDSHFYITYTSGGTTYYLNDQGLFNTNKTTEWELDNNGNIKVKGGTVYLGCTGNRDDRELTASATAQNRLSIDNNGLYYRRGNGTYLYLHGTTSATTTPRLQNNTNDLAGWTEENDSYTTPSFTPGAYTLKVWERDGSAVRKTITVNSAADADVYDMGLCNNDAIKFQIEGLDDGKQALVSVTLLLQALDPYIDKMDIVCHDDRDVLQLTQSFTADNFSVAGDKFIFYVPEDYANEMLNFTFSALYSKYGDETYYDRSGHGAGRYSFVRSPYFITVDGDGDGGLYNNTAYDPDHTYVDKVYTVDAGKYRFKFNNAEDLAHSTTPGTLEEYPFSVSIYKNTENPGDPTASPAIAASTDLGTFIKCKLQANLEDQKSGTYYVFTADETRWNIAPTYNWQHRYYAFYRMEIELRAKTFTPDFTWEKVYTSTLYDDNGTDKEDSMWKLTLDVSDTDNNNQHVDGYLTYQEIIDHIKGREADTEHGITAIASTLDPNNVDAPASMKQILSVDGTPLYAMLNSSKNSQVKTLTDLKRELAPNAIVFLPENTTSTLDNVAYQTASGTFRAGKDILLTDKQPFYTPYDIKIDAANYATYTRELTHEGYDPDVNATIMLPFTLSLNNGVHTNTDGSCSFTVNQMLSGTDMQLVSGSSVDYGTGFFTKVTGSTTEANKPYMIHVESVNPPTTTSGTSGEGSGTEGEGEGTSGESGSGTSGESGSQSTTISFIAKQQGALIVATPKTAATTPTHESELSHETEPYCTGLLHKGEEASANFGSDTYYFTCYGSFSGSKYDRAVSENVFYFGKNRYVNLHTLWPANKQYMFNYPFRAAYIYTTTAPSPSKEMKWFDISFDEYQGNYGIATGVTDVENVVDLMVRPGTGCMTITAAREQDVNIYTANGIRKERMSLQDGETRIVNMPAGIYIVNNVKVIVK